MAGLFDDAGISSDELAVSKLKKGIYDGTLENVETKLSKANDPYLVLTYRIPEWDYGIQDWFRLLPQGKTLAMCDDTDDSFNVFVGRNNQQVRQTEKAFFINAYKQIKRRLMDLGVPEEMVNKVDPKDLIGRPVRLSIDENPSNDFPKVTKVSVPESSGTRLPQAPTIPSGPPVMAAPVMAAPVSQPAPAAPVSQPAPAAPVSQPAPAVAQPQQQVLSGNPFGNIG